MEISEVRRRLRATIETARHESMARRERSDAASRAYDLFLERVAAPAFHLFATALVGEGLRFRVFTPAHAVRLAYDGGSEDFIEIGLDTTADPPRVIGRTSRSRGRRSLAAERPVRAGTAVADLTDEDVLDFLIEEIVPFVER